MGHEMLFLFCLWAVTFGIALYAEWDTFYAFPVALGGFILLAVGVGIAATMEERQGQLARRQATAQAGIATEKLRTALLQAALPRMQKIREALHAEMVELSGTEAEFAHTLAAARAHKEGITKGAEDQRGFERGQYKHALDIRRLQNQLAAEIDRASLRPLRIEAQKTRLRVEGNERVVEQILTQQAIEQARGGGTAKRKTGDVAGLRVELAYLIEQRKAEGAEYASLEAALEALPDEGGDT